MSVTINYNKNLSKKNSSNIVLFLDENFNISGLKNHISGPEYSFIADLIKTKDIKKKILSFDINSKRKIILVALKKNIKNSDLSNNELELLKDIYIDLKVKSMNNDDLKNFAIENISLQIKSTIGKDEELEAWQEMEDFFKDEFDNKIQDIKIKMNSQNNEINSLEIEEKHSITETKGEDKKLDMWED